MQFRLRDLVRIVLDRVRVRGNKHPEVLRHSTFIRGVICIAHGVEKKAEAALVQVANIAQTNLPKGRRRLGAPERVSMLERPEFLRVCVVRRRDLHGREG